MRGATIRQRAGDRGRGLCPFPRFFSPYKLYGTTTADLIEIFLDRSENFPSILSAWEQGFCYFQLAIFFQNQHHTLATAELGGFFDKESLDFRYGF